jgi:hypothetical protein
LVDVSVADQYPVFAVEDAEITLACGGSRESVENFVTAYLHCL